MCGSHGFNNACCPDGQIIVEKICGNIGATGNRAVNDRVLWKAGTGVDDYIQGTFEIFNNGTNNIVATVDDAPNQNFTTFPGFSNSLSVNKPTQFEVDLHTNQPTGSKFCITLYKRVF